MEYPSEIDRRDSQGTVLGVGRCCATAGRVRLPILYSERNHGRDRGGKYVPKRETAGAEHVKIVPEEGNSEIRFVYGRYLTS